MDRIRRVPIVGMGALGILYEDFSAGTLRQEQVTLLADSDRVKNYRDHPVYCNDKEWKFQAQDGVVSGSRGAAQSILFAVEAAALETAARAVKDQVGKDTVILSVLNGTSSEEVIGHILGREHMLYCVAQGMDVVKPGSQFAYSHMEEICIGIPESEAEKEPFLKKVTDLFDETGLLYTREADILHRSWCEWMLNVGVNQAVTVVEGTYGTVQKPGKERHMMTDTMAEVVAPVGKENIQVTGEDLQSYVDLVDTLNPEGMPSTCQDGLAHKRSEVEFFVGAVTRKVEKYGLDVPTNRELYQRITKMEKAH